MYWSLQNFAGKALKGIPSMEVFARALGILGGWIEGMMGKFSSRAPFEVLEDEPLTWALLLQPFGGIFPK